MEKANRIFCVGRNYAAHAKELANQVPNKPVIFIKPITCLVPVGDPIPYPKHGHDLQHEVEVAVRIAADGKSIDAITLGLDLTLRDIQTELKQQGLPWELAKAFDHSAPIGAWHPLTNKFDLTNLDFACHVNGKLRQHGNTKDMLFPINHLIQYLSSVWKLIPGDIIFTGTPQGVGPLSATDTIEISSDLMGRSYWNVI